MSKNLKIIDYFDSLVNEVDLKAEKLLAKFTSLCDENVLDEEERRLVRMINERRRLFIDTIENLKRHNLSINLSEKSDNQPLDDDEENDVKMYDKYCFILDKFDMDMNESASKDDDFYDETYCLDNSFGVFHEFEEDEEKYNEVFEDDEVTINKTFGYLIVLEDGALSRQELSLFTEILYCPDEHNEYEENEHSANNKFSTQLDQARLHTIESNIFDAKFVDVQKHVMVKFRVFKKASENFIIQTTKAQLLAIGTIIFFDTASVFTVKQQAIELFFKSPITLEIMDKDNLRGIWKNKLAIILYLLKWYESNVNVEFIKLRVNNRPTFRLVDFISIKSLQKLAVFLNGKIIDSANGNVDLPNLKIAIISYIPPFNRKFNRKPSYSRCVKNNSFDKLINLETLVLARNFIEKIDSNAFNGLFNLKKLNLSHNKLKSIDQLHLRHLSNLIELNISSNPISRIDDGTFSCLPNLKTLILDDLSLVSIGEFLLNSLTSLESLRISSNTISNIHPNAFARLNQLTSLTLSVELLQSMDAELFAGLINLKHLKIAQVQYFNFDLIKNLPNLEELNLEDINLNRLAGPDDESVFRSRLKIIKFKKCEIQSLEARAFYGFSNLEIIEIGHNRSAIDINSQAFESLTNLTRLNFKHSYFMPIEPSTFHNLPNLKEFSLKCNNYNSPIDLRPSFSGSNNLKILEIIENRIEQLDENAFSCFEKLYLLDLSSNKLTCLEENHFAGLKRLKRLYLNVNELTCLASNTFKHAVNLVKLDLSCNPIEKIESDSFRGLVNLKTLLLDCAKLAGLPPNAFVDLNNLVRLYLRSNQIESLDEHTFNGLGKLQKLLLNNNQIARIHASAFDPLTNLKYLSLRQNNLTNIEPSTFKNQSKLIKLNIKSNKLAKINCGTFDSLVNLQWLSFRDNYIQLIENNSFDRLQKLSFLEMNNIELTHTDFILFEKLELLDSLLIDDDCENQFANLDSLRNLKYLKDQYT